MSKTSRKAAKKWRKNQAPPVNRWYVAKNLSSGRWSAFPPCTCYGDLFCSHPPTRFRTHAAAIAWADKQARKKKGDES